MHSPQCCLAENQQQPPKARPCETAQANTEKSAAAASGGRRERLPEKCSPNCSPTGGPRETQQEKCSKHARSKLAGHLWSNVRAPAAESTDELRPMFDQVWPKSGNHWPDWGGPFRNCPHEFCSSMFPMFVLRPVRRGAIWWAIVEDVFAMPTARRGCTCSALCMHFVRGRSLPGGVGDAQPQRAELWQPTGSPQPIESPQHVERLQSATNGIAAAHITRSTQACPTWHHTTPGTSTHDRAESGQDRRHAAPRATGLPRSRWWGHLYHPLACRRGSGNLSESRPARDNKGDGHAESHDAHPLFV